MTDAPYLSGSLLLSMPGIGDPRFERAVIAICNHDEHGALGVMINHVHAGVSARAVLEQLDIDPGAMPADVPVYMGGPVEPSRGFVLHSLDYGGQGTLQVGDAWALTATLDVLRDIAAGRGPSRWLLALGYAGWEEGQLEEELTRHGWLTAEADLPTLLDTPAEARWPRAFATLGIDIGQLSPNAGHA